MEGSYPSSSISKRFATSSLSWWLVLLFLPARLVFAFLAQGLVTGVFSMLGSTHPLQEAAAWWPINSIITDALCLLSLAWLTRREGIGLIDLLGARGKQALRQLVWTPVFLLAVSPAVVLSSVLTQSIYGTWRTPLFTVASLPLGGALYSVLIWPIIWVLAEELGYLGYLLPRLEALSGKTWVAAAAVTFFWGLQHIAIPFLPDTTYLLWRLLSAWAATGGMTLVFILLRRRLVATIAAHYLFDLSTGFMIGLLPLLSRSAA
jgi:membrane protease YdiL (CAAX protease family)